MKITLSLVADGEPLGTVQLTVKSSPQSPSHALGGYNHGKGGERRREESRGREGGREGSRGREVEGGREGGRRRMGNRGKKRRGKEGGREGGRKEWRR